MNKKMLFCIGVCATIFCCTNGKKAKESYSNNKADSLSTNIIGITENTNDSAVFVVNGHELPLDILSAIDKNKIATITVVKDTTLAKRYGEKGKRNGVVLITLK